MIWLLLLLACGTDDCEPVPEPSLGDPMAWETALIATPGPDQPDVAYVSAEDGLDLAYRDWLPDGPPQAVAVLVHGSSAHGGLYDRLAFGLAAQGILTRAIDVRGHGLSRCVRPGVCATGEVPSYVDDSVTWVGRPGDAADANQHARDVQVHLADLRASYPGVKVVLLGHSSGAGLVTRVIENQGMSEIDAVVVLAPFHHFEQPQNDLRTYECGAISGNSYSQVDVGAVGDAIRGNVHRYVLTLHKQPAYLDDLDTLAYTYPTMIGMAAADSQRFHLAYSGPTLWVAGTEDIMLDLELSRQEFEKMPGAQAFLTVTDTSHVGVSWSPVVAEWIGAFVRDPGSVVSQTIPPV